MARKKHAMDSVHHHEKSAATGIRFASADRSLNQESVGRFIDWLKMLSLDRLVRAISNDLGTGASIHAHMDLAESDTTGLCAIFDLDTVNRREDLEREILLAMLIAPLPFEFPCYEELESAVRIRCNIVAAARKTALAFHTTEVDRPTEYWEYTPGMGFTLLPGKSLIDALVMATQPDVSGGCYSFSCYRATEYMMLLGLAQELAQCHPELLEQLEDRWRIEPIMSGSFHDVFLREHGSMENPLPRKYYVPGDRVWFRNPDSESAEVTGYEGSWVIYLGNGLFSNFWETDKPYTLTAKCVEIFHWRHATYRDAEGTLQMDECKVQALTEASMRSPEQVTSILDKIARYRDGRGIYQDGGCIDTSREHVRWIRRGTSDLVLPSPSLT